MASQGIRIAIDRGGTFTDAWAEVPGREKHIVFKILSVCPDENDDAPTECIRQISTPGGGGYGSKSSEHDDGKLRKSFADGLVVPPREQRAFLTNGSLGVRHSTATGN